MGGSNEREEYAEFVLKMVPIGYKSRYTDNQLKRKLRRVFDGHTDGRFWSVASKDLFTPEQWRAYKIRYEK